MGERKGGACSFQEKAKNVKVHSTEWAFQKDSSHVWMWNAEGLNLRNKKNHETTQRTRDFILKVMGDH